MSGAGQIAKAAPEPNIHLRWMIRRDWPEVLDIEKLSFDEPWSDDQFEKALRARNCIGMVGESDEVVHCFMIYLLHPEGYELINFAVHPDMRRQGLGKAMVDRLKSKLSPGRRNALSTVVSEKNLRGQLFFKSQRFTAVGFDPNAYEDAETSETFGSILFEYRLGSEYEPLNRIKRFY